MGHRMGDQALRLLLGLLSALAVEPIAVGRFDNQDIAGRRGGRIPQDRHLLAAEVSCIKHGRRAPTRSHDQLNGRGA